MPNDEDAGAGSLVISSARDHRAGGAPRAEQACDHARRSPLSLGEAGECLSPRAAARACATSRMTTVAGRNGRVAHRVEHALLGPAAPSRPDGRACRGPMGRPFRCAAGCTRRSPAHPHVPSLDRPCRLAGRIVEIRLHCGFCATEPTRDVTDREALRIPLIPRERHGAAALCDTLERWFRGRSHACRRYRGHLTVPPGAHARSDEGEPCKSASWIRAPPTPCDRCVGSPRRIHLRPRMVDSAPPDLRARSHDAVLAAARKIRARPGLGAADVRLRA